jgi:hypothetical protein
MQNTAFIVRVASLLCVCFLPACGGQPPPKQPEAVHEDAPHPTLAIRSELGSLDPAAVKQVFHTLDDKFIECQRRGLDRVEVLSGSVKFFVRIAQDGSAKWAYLEESDVGDQATEKCLIGAVMGARWPKPDGGDGEARYGMGLSLDATRPANDWAPEKVARALEQRGAAIRECRAGTSTPFRATMYVGPGGRVLAAGVVAGGKDHESKVDCIVSVLMKLKGLPTPGSWPAKVSFSL